MNRCVIGFVLVWFTGVGFVTILSLVIGLGVALGSGDWELLSFVLIPPGMFAFGVALHLYGLSSYRDDADFLLRFLRETFEAEEENRASLPL